MPYNSNTPLAGDSLGTTQPIINGNFAQIQTDFSINHGPLDGTHNGKHLFLQMPDQSSAPTTAANEGGLYVSAVTNISNLFFREESDGTAQQISGFVNTGFPGECPLFGGLGLKWGTITMNASTVPIVYTGLTLNAFGTDTRAIFLQATNSLASGFNVRITTKVSTGFTAQVLSGGPATFDWVAIGL